MTILLNGSESFDPDADDITYLWNFSSAPDDSTAVILNSTNEEAYFIPNVVGEYIVRLVVNDGVEDSLTDDISITVTEEISNKTPVANAGDDQAVSVGTLVTLNGTQSSDPDLDILTYKWEFQAVPKNSSTLLSNISSPSPEFTPDVAGIYTIQLTVNDGSVDSNIDSISVTVTEKIQNSPPTANAGIDQSVTVGKIVTLDASKSFDLDSSQLTYNWSFFSAPIGNTASIENPPEKNTTFTPNVAGTYIVHLVVNDGATDSLIDSAQITVTQEKINNAPIAITDSSKSVYTDIEVFLDGSESYDPDGDTITYEWEFVSSPVGSSALLYDYLTATPYFTPDVDGDYVFNLVVSDGENSSATSSITISSTTLVIPDPPVLTTDIYVFSTDILSNVVYLGCWSCSQFELESIHNSFGTYWK